MLIREDDEITDEKGFLVLLKKTSQHTSKALHIL